MAKETKKETKQEIQKAEPARPVSPFEAMDKLFESDDLKEFYPVKS